MTHRARGEYFPAIDILRGFAAYSVIMLHVIAHTNWTEFPQTGLLSWFRSGSLGVDLFFVISGFVVYYSSINIFNREGYSSFLVSFLLRRFFRLYPLYALTLIASIYMSQRYLLDVPNLWVHLLAHLTFIHSFNSDWFSSINGVNWSIAIEVHFYILIALFIAQLGKINGSIILLGALVLAWIWRWASWQLIPDDGDALYLYRLFVVSTQLPGRLDQFAIGMTIATLVRSAPFASWRRLHWLMPVSTTLAALTIYCFVFPQVNFWPSGQVAFIFSRTLIALAFGCVIFAACQIKSTRFLQWSRPFRYAGTISYGLYLWHLPFLVMLKSSELPPLAIAALTLTATTLTAAACWHILEKPLIAFGRRLESKLIPRLD